MNATTKQSIQAALVLALASVGSAAWAQTEKAEKAAPVTVTTANVARPAPGLRPPVAERRAVPMAASVEELAPSGRRPSSQALNARAPAMVASACPGVAASKEQTRAGGKVCAPTGGKESANPVQLAQATVPLKTVQRSDAAEASPKAKAAQDAVPASQLADATAPAAIASGAAAPMPVTLKAGGVEPIPTLSEWGVGLLVALLGLFGLRQARERSGRHWLSGMFALVLGTTLMAANSPASATNPDIVTYIHTDVSGSPLAATDAAGTVVWKESYRAYGERRLNQSGSGQQQQWFHGKEQDSTGLQYFGARYYDPVVGRFMGIDPVDFQDGNLHSFNRYAYGNNNPVKHVDPNGKWAEDAVLALPGMYLGSRSLVDNFRQGNWLAAAVDAGGLLADGAALALPGVPGGAGLAIKAMREGSEIAAKGAAQSSKQASDLARHLGYAEKYGADGVKQLENGRFRYYGEVQPASKTGEMAGRRYVHEFDPATGASRGWHETVDHAGNVRQVRPELNNGSKSHYRFDSNGKYSGSW